MVFVGSFHGDSCVYRVSDTEARNVCCVVTNTSPVLAISPSAGDTGVITTLSGVGTSASLNRIMTSGIGAARLARDSSLTEGITERLFLVFKDTCLIRSSPTHTAMYRISVERGQVHLVEDPAVHLPVDLISANDYVTGQVYCVSRRSAYRLTQQTNDSVIVDQMWTSEYEDIVNSNYDSGLGMPVMATKGLIYKLSTMGCYERSARDTREQSAIGSFRGTCIVCDWTGSVFEVNDDVSKQLVSGDHSDGAVGRSVAMGPVPASLLDPLPPGKDDRMCCLIGFSDGSMSAFVYDLRVTGDVWVPVATRKSIGIQPLQISPCTLGNPAKPFFIISGDRPSLVSFTDGQLVVTELVDSATGTVQPMFEITVAGQSGLLWYLDRDGLLQSAWLNPDKITTTECHVQRRMLCDPSGPIDTLPVGVEVMESHGIIAVAVSSLRTTNPSSDSPPDWIEFFDVFQLNQLSRFVLSPADRVSCISAFAGGLLVGTGTYSDPHPAPSVEPTEGRLILLTPNAAGNATSWTESGSSTILKADGLPAGPVYGISCIGDTFVAAIVVRTLFIVKLSSRDGGVAEFVHVASVDADFLCVSIATQEVSGGFRIVVGDISKSCSLFMFQYDDFSLYPVAKDLVTASTTATELLGDAVLMGEELGNVYALRLIEPTLGRLERVEGVNVGQSSVTAIRRVGGNGCWVGTNDGSISLIQSTTADGGDAGSRRGINVTGRLGDVIEPTRVQFPSVRSRMQIGQL